MKKLLLGIILLCSVSACCSTVPSDDATGKTNGVLYIYNAGTGEKKIGKVYEVRVDGCEYLLFPNSSTPVHKGNCDNPCHWSEK